MARSKSRNRKRQKKVVRKNRSSTNKSFFKRNWKSLLAIGGFMLGVLGFLSDVLGIYDHFGSENISNQEFEEINLIEPFEKTDSSFKVLLLPLHPDRDCNIEDADYETAIIEYFNQKPGLLGGREIKIRTGSIEKCPVNFDSAISTGELNNADLVLWGTYDEKCTGPSKFKLKYNAIGDNLPVTLNYKGGVSKFEVDAIEEIYEGRLLNDLDIIIQKIDLLNLYTSQNYQNIIMRKLPDLLAGNGDVDIEELFILINALDKVKGNDKFNDELVVKLVISAMESIRDEMVKVKKPDRNQVDCNEIYLFYLNQRSALLKLKVFTSYAKKNDVLNRDNRVKPLIRLLETVIYTNSKQLDVISNKNGWD